MFPGFIPNSRGSLAIDVVVVGMAVILPLLTYSIYQVKVHKNYARHGRLQYVLGAILLVAVTFFELEVRIFGWRHLAKVSPYYDNWLFPSLYVHLVMAISATFLWIVTLWTAYKQFGWPPKPGAFSPRHRRLARWAAFTMYGTTVTGYIFYYLAFVA